MNGMPTGSAMPKQEVPPKPAGAASGFSFSGPAKGKSSDKKTKLFVKYLSWGGLGFVALLNMQPWIELAKQIAKEITNIPFLDSLVKIPFLGGWIEWGFLNIIPILGIVLWGWTQLMEILPNLVKNPSNEIILYRWLAYAFEVFICFLRFPPYEGGIEAIKQDFPHYDGSLIDYWKLALLIITIGSFEAFFWMRKSIEENF